MPRRALLGALAALLLLLSGAGASGTLRSSPPPTAHAADLARPVSLRKDVTLTLEAAIAVPTETGETVAFRFRLTNQSGEAFDFFPYWLRLELGGRRIPVTLLDADHTVVEANRSGEFIFSATLPNPGDHRRLALRLIRWDMSAADFERKIGELTLDWNAAEAKASASDTLPLTGGDVRIDAARRSVRADGEAVRAAFSLRLENTGRTPRHLPALRTLLLTDDGAVYPLTADEGDTEGSAKSGNAGEGMLLVPRLPSTIRLSARLPAGTKLERPAIIVLRPGDGEGGPGAEVPLLVLRNLPPEGADDRKADGRALTEPVTVEGPGGARMILVFVGFPSRFPDGKDDIVAARLLLTNAGRTPVALPRWDGLLEDEAGAAFPTTFVPDETKAVLYPGERLAITVNIRVPYTWTFTAGNLRLLPSAESGGAGDGRAGAVRPVLLPWPELSYRLFSDSILLPSVLDEAKTVEHRGQTFTLRVVERRVETHLEADIVTALLRLENLTPRPLPFPGLSAAFRTADGRLFPAEIRPMTLGEGEGTASPVPARGTVTLLARARLPNGEAADLSLLVALVAGATEAGGRADNSALRPIARFFVPPSVGPDTPRLALGDRTVWRGRDGAESVLWFRDAARLISGGGDIVSFVFDVENTGRYPFRPNAWRGELHLADGTVLPAAVAPEKTPPAVLPGETLRYTATVRLDRRARTSGALFLLVPDPSRAAPEAVPWGQIAFALERDVPEPAAVAPGEKTLLEVDGQELIGVVRERRLYRGDDADVVTAVVAWTNGGRAPLRLQAWRARFLDGSGRVYPAEAPEGLELLPGGTAAVEVVAPLPEGDVRNLTLLFVQETTEDDRTTVRPVAAFRLPAADDGADPTDTGLLLLRGSDLNDLAKPNFAAFDSGERELKKRFAFDLYPLTADVDLTVTAEVYAA
ncbi:MAG: hypothetical protein KM312_00125, partial [Hydrogenibacillus schlegelii]|nr:hypothetical protein [Hydrogenibacillus schlegelii]